MSSIRIPKWQQSACLAVAFMLMSVHGGNSEGSATARLDCAAEGKINNSVTALKSALLCGTGYNPGRRPVKNQQDRVAMYIGADVLNVELIHNTYVQLEMTVELSMQWYDAFLHWNKKSHGSVDNLNVSEQDIWTPRLAAKSLFKSKVQSTKHCFQSKCILSADGEVMYSVMCTFAIECMDSSTHWAFETKSCPLRIFTPEFNINQLSLFHFQRRLSYSVAGVLPYKITSFQMAVVNNSMNPEFRMDISVERMIGPHLVSFMVLINLLILLNLMVTWFRIDTTVRAVVTFTSLGLHGAYLVILSWYSNAKMHPAIGLAYVLLGSSLVTILLAAIFAYSQRVSNQDPIEVPRFLQVFRRAVSKVAALQPVLRLRYINSVTSIQPNSNLTVVGLPSHLDQMESTSKGTITEDSDEEDIDPTKLGWSAFVQPFDRIIFCGIAIVYAVMLMMYFLL